MSEPPDLEKTQEIRPSEMEKEILKSNVVPFTGRQHRVTADSVIRHLLSVIDKVDHVAVVFRLQGKGSLLVNYSTDMDGTDLAMGGLSLTALGEQALGLATPMKLTYTTTDPTKPTGAPAK